MSARRRPRICGLVAAVAVAFALVGGACSGATTAAPSSATGITVTGAWARASSAMAAAGAAYMTIHNAGSAADAVVGASSPAAGTVEVHETVAMGSPAPSASGTGGGMMGMRPIARLEVPAGGSVELKPGSYHVMLIGLKEDLKAGGSIQVTLKFEKAGEVTVSAAIRES